MIKVVLIATAALVGTASLASAATHKVTRSHTMMVKKKKTIAANGRCGGVSYGTGARRCGTLSGGASGGISSRN